VKAFDGRLAFGTAGIRGPLSFGPQAMNRVVVSQTTAGLARYLLSRVSDPVSPLRVLVGFDARKNSARFAQDTAEILSGHGIDVFLTPGHVPTPIVAFGVRHLACDAAIMVTASHNPARDNGYKVYFGGGDEGSQIVPPVDQHIEHQIGLVAANLRFDEIPRNTDRVSSTPATLVGDYLHATVSSVGSAGSSKNPITVVYTAMHGVGGDTFLQVLESAGFSAPVLVEEQFEPDPDFPTVAFPTPKKREPSTLPSPGQRSEC
jgi:phosphomannomutase